jgi:hypothetical protein
MSQVMGYVKLGLIPVLAGVLYLVLYDGATSTADHAAKQDPATTKAPDLTVEAETTHRIDENNSPPRMARDLQPTLPLKRDEEVAEVDPFDRRMIFPEKESANTLDPLIANDDRSLVSSTGAKSISTATLKVQVVFQTRDGISAMLDDRIVRVGDLLEDGRQVIQITPQNLVLALPTIH